MKEEEFGIRCACANIYFFKYTKYLMCQPQLNEGDTVDENQFLKNLGKVRWGRDTCK